MESNILINDQTIKCRLLEPQELSRPTKETNFPIVIEGTKDVSFDFLHNFAKKHKDALKDLLVKHGAILFRGFEVINSEHFQIIMSALTENLASSYDGPAIRRTVSSNVFTTTEIADNAMTPPHTEIAYAYKRPGILAFYCNIEPLIYGETPLFNCASVYNALSKEGKEILDRGVKYIRKHPKKYPKFFELIGAGRIGTSWTQRYGTENKQEVEKAVEASGFEFEWGKHDELKIISYPPAVITHPITNKKNVNIFYLHYYNAFKSIQLFKNRYSFWVRFKLILSTIIMALSGKGVSLTKLYTHNEKPFPRFLVKELHNLFWEHSVIFRWKKNDVLVIDNIALAHGRMNVSGPRKILAALGNEYTVDKVH